MRPEEIVRNGRRLGYQRYLCKLCSAVFREPSHESSRLPSFKRYRCLEALSALAHDGNELRAQVAARLGVHRSRITQWESEHREQPVTLLEPAQVADGRYARRTHDMAWAPFTVAEADKETFLKASFGELRFWARQLKLLTEAELDHTADQISDRSLPLEERYGHLKWVRAPLLDTKPSLFVRLPT